MKLNRKTLIRIGAVVVVAAAALGVWWAFQPKGTPEGFITGNGRIEAVEIDISAKSPGRVAEILVDEGELVQAGQVLARMDTSVLEAQKAEAEAGLQRVLSSIGAAESQVVQAQSQRAATDAVIAQRVAELNAARRRFSRSQTLASEGAAAQQELDDDAARVESASAAVSAARAQLAAADAAIATARTQVAAARSAVDAARATITRLQADIDDSALKAPRGGRIQYRIAQAGEVVGGGGRVLSLVDLSDVYMTFFLPETAVGRVALGTPVRLVLDAAPDRPIPATISFVADVAQFTPRTVETESERQKLMFRVRARVAPEMLQANITQVKTGLPGVAYVQLDREQPWPANLAVRSQ